MFEAQDPILRDPEITETSSQQEDNKTLNYLLESIKKMANTKTCDPTGSYSFTAIGSKACGGPTGYIAYTNSINVKLFLEKVEYYTAQQSYYNQKWQIMSTCDIPMEPSGVICQDGELVLLYDYTTEF
jgi:hypothetical protein